MKNKDKEYKTLQTFRQMKWHLRTTKYFTESFLLFSEMVLMLFIALKGTLMQI